MMLSGYGDGLIASRKECESVCVCVCTHICTVLYYMCIHMYVYTYVPVECKAAYGNTDTAISLNLQARRSTGSLTVGNFARLAVYANRQADSSVINLFVGGFLAQP